MIEFLRSRIKLYRARAGDKENKIAGLFTDEGNIAMAERIAKTYERMLKRLETTQASCG